MDYDQLVDTLEKWKGKNYVFCKGRIVTGPNGIKNLLLTTFLIIKTTSIFITFNWKWFDQYLSVAPLIITIFLCIFVIILILLTAFTDSGVLPKKLFKMSYSIKRYFQINNLGNIHRFKICSTCYIVKPLRSNHCGDCDNCIERFDHHCLWLGCCIGKRNYKYFLLMIFFLLILEFIIVISCIIMVIKVLKYNQVKYENPLLACIIPIYLIIMCSTKFIFVFSLFYYHLKLILVNTTTREMIKQLFNRISGNPFMRDSLIMNLKRSIFPVIPLISHFEIMSKNSAIEVLQKKMSDRPITYTAVNSFSNPPKKKIKVKICDGKEYVSERSEKNFFPNETNHIDIKPNRQQELIIIEKNFNKSNKLFTIEEKIRVSQSKEYNNLSCNNNHILNEKLKLNDPKLKKTHTINEIINRKNYIQTESLFNKEKMTIDLNTIDPY